MTFLIRELAKQSQTSHEARNRMCSAPSRRLADSFEDQRWRAIPAQERGRILWRVAELIETRADELAVVESLNQGQPVGQTRWLMAFAADCFRYYAGWVDKLHGITAELLVGTTALHGYTLREPMGVAALIVPWNAPMLTATAKIAAALTAGCSCVLKPAEETPLTALLLGQILAEAGVPPGVVNIVTGFGDAGAALSDHPDIDKISFTGSTEVGKLIIKAAAGNLKKVTLELGGKSPFIVFADADLAEAIPAAARSIFGNTGQGCTVGSRLFVHESHLDEVIQGVAKLASEIRVGYSMDPAAEIGPLISDKQLKTVTGYVESAVTDGANVVVGGNRIGDTGFYFQPTVLPRLTTRCEQFGRRSLGPCLPSCPSGRPMRPSSWPTTPRMGWRPASGARTGRSHNRLCDAFGQAESESTFTHQDRSRCRPEAIDSPAGVASRVRKVCLNTWK